MSDPDVDGPDVEYPVVLASWAEARWDRDGDVAMLTSVLTPSGESTSQVVFLTPARAARLAGHLAMGAAAAALQRAGSRAYLWANRCP